MAAMIAVMASMWFRMVSSFAIDECRCDPAFIAIQCAARGIVPKKMCTAPLQISAFLRLKRQASAIVEPRHR
jgi:hypothetical protein